LIQLSFEKLLSLNSLEFLKGPLICWQASFTIFREGVRFIFTHAIAMVAYLGSCAFVALIIIFSFLQYHHSFLLETTRKCSSKMASILDTFEEDVNFIYPSSPLGSSFSNNFQIEK
jgi:hypothetical protein